MVLRRRNSGDVPLGAPGSADAVTVVLAVTDSVAEFPAEEMVGNACSVGTPELGVVCGVACCDGGSVLPPPPPPPQAARAHSNAKPASARRRTFGRCIRSIFAAAAYDCIIEGSKILPVSDTITPQ